MLRSDATLSDYTRKVLAEGLAQGHMISYATARSFISSWNIVSAIPWRYPVLLYNGALLYDPVLRRKIDGRFLSADVTEAWIRVGKAFGFSPLVFALGADEREWVLHERLQREGERRFYASRPGDPRFKEVESLENGLPPFPMMLTYIGLPEELQPLMEAGLRSFGSEVHVNFMPDSYISGHYFLEISHPLANKRDGLELWARHVGCAPGQITVFGDNLNDVPLFERAGFRIAVANAHPTLKSMADAVTGANDEDGVAAYLARHLSESRVQAQKEKTGGM